ncbi:acriflavine resistance protein AcrE [Vibrio halioticoli NBRC 102217]|uniref:Acriflavine resistance protein AcrE n=1 Tax=Vibrio halioticoli NBRC 102217 TaxID=1219072 RepID=V5FHZ9_9VIBR|nr:efflux RND transporter periplasmic adaptor subunit [Vibrio halioticoli]GAD89456.1 acriflavine resistance protein AcrE [Vibrio halioticoli NBRC 102217]
MSLSKSLRISWCLLLSVLLLGCGEQGRDHRPPQGPLHVDVLTLTPTTLRLTRELPGRVTAFKQAEVRPQVTGILQSRLYKEGSQVQAGDVLYQIDPSTYQSTVKSAQAQLTKALASEASSKKTADRYAQLLKKKLTSQQNYDDADAAYQEAKAEVAIRQADLDYANLELSYTQIKAPISGQVGLSQVSEGSLLTAQQTSYLTTIIQTSNVYIDMQQSSLALSKIKQTFTGLNKKPKDIPISIILEDGTTYDQTAYLEFSSTKVSNSTGTVTLRAIVSNPQNRLLDGMYVRAHIALPEARDYLVVPQSVVVRSQSGQPFIFTVDQNNKTIKKSVVLGDEVDNGWIVEEGLVAGEKVVISNLSNVKNDVAVVIDSGADDAQSALAPQSAPAPKSEPVVEE